MKKYKLFYPYKHIIIAITLLFAAISSVQAAEPLPGLHGTNQMTGLVSLTATDTIKIPQDSSSLQDAIQQVLDGGIIEISSGTYYSPSGGFSLSNLQKSFTIQAAPGASVVLSGNGSNRILSSYNNSPDQAGAIVIKDITIANGYANQDGVGVVTLYTSKISFINVTFRDNYKSSSPGRTVGATVDIADDSTVFFINCEWKDNTSEDGGAGLGIRSSDVFIHNSSFLRNRTITQVYNHIPGGGAINVANSSLRVTNTRFEDNRAAGHGGAIWAQGLWDQPETDIVIANSTFINNQISRGVSSPSPIEGGAVSAEDHLALKVYSSRFITNQAGIGGAISIFRASAEIYQSVFQGNRATDTSATSGFGGAINFKPHDRSDHARLTVEDSFFQGRYGAVTTVAQTGGGIKTLAPSTSLLPDVTILRSIFYDLDVATPQGSGRRPSGGALAIAGADLLMQDSLVLNSDAVGSEGGYGGGMLIYMANASIDGLVAAYNTADTYGGALFIKGSNIDIAGSTFMGNVFSPGISEPEYQSYGAAIFASPETSLNEPVTGNVVNSKFINNTGLAIFDDDRSNGPINAVIYNNNQFYETTFGDKVYKDSLAAACNPSGLNTLVVSHSGGYPSIDKSTINNTAYSNIPNISTLFAAPSILLSTSAYGDAGPSPAFLTYVWSGSSATLDGTPLSSRSGIIQTTTVGTHTLNASGVIDTVQVSNSPQPVFSLNIASGAPPSLNWTLSSGSYLDMAIDNGLSYNPAPSGSVYLTASNDIYSFYGVTEEGGYYSIVVETPFEVFLPITIR